MFCQNCGNKLKKDATFCDKCGQKVNENLKGDKAAKQKDDKKLKESKEVEQTVNVNIKEKVKEPYSTAKLVIGIISMVLFLLICVQSCAVGLGNALSDSGETSGTSGFLCAIFMLIGGIVSVATRNSKGKGGAISAIILYVIAALFTIGTGSSYGDLPIWGSVSLIFGMVNLASILSKNKIFLQKNKKNLLNIGLIVISVIIFIIGASLGINSADDTSNDTSKKETTNKTEVNKYALDEMFKFDDLEITLGSDISFTVVDNEFSDYYKKDVVKVPVTVKNISDETHGLNYFYYELYGSQGTQLDSVASFFDDSIDDAGDMRSGASYTKYFYFIYDGNGKYSIEFDNYSDKLTVEFDVNK